VTTIQPDYFTAYSSLKMARDARGVLVVEFHSKGGPLTFTARDHTEFVDAFYRIGQDRANAIVIFTGTGGQFIAGIDFASFGNVADPGVWSQVHDEGVQILENLLNIRVPVIAAVEGRLDVHSEYALLANVIVAGEGATFNDLLLNPKPLSARTAYDWGVVTEVVRDGEALSRAIELAYSLLKVPEVTRRNTRVHFTQPLKERVVREVGYGLSLEGASAADLVKSMQATAKA
jgi:enoyl-CoA hydratase/carnithine racemase